MLSWYKPALDSPAKIGVTLVLLMLRVTGLLVDAAPAKSAPAETLGVVGPKPTPKRTTLSFAFAATVGYPRDVPAGPRIS
jgi:hypothetical protein